MQETTGGPRPLLSSFEPVATSRRFGFGFGSRPPVPGRPAKVWQMKGRRAQGLDLGLARGSQFPPEEISRTPVFLFVSSTRVDQAGAMFGWAWLEAFCLEAIKP